MLIRWALAFFLIALVAALFGFSGIAADSAAIARILFVVFLVVFALTLMAHLLGFNRRR
jgi:uncharacterized membrane protein YtjA (UPF0391 family)